MSAGAVQNKAGPSASKDKKAKRPRKRSRNKKRTAQVEDDGSSSSSSSSSDDSDDEQEATPKAAPVETTNASPKKADSDSDSDFDDENEEKEDGGEGDAKRKRKRKCTQKKTAEEPSKATAVPAAITTSNTSVAKPATLTPDQVGPDPNTDLRLSDQAKQAIQYAQVYTKDKSQWKFNKAKQNWLLRNALSVPPSDYDASLARKQGSNTDAAEDAEEAEEGENFVPDDFVAVVTAYLTSVMGGARQRLVESLQEAVNAPAATVAPPQPEAGEDAAKATVADEQSNDAAANGTAATTKSVSFGNSALESERKEEAAEAAGLPTGTDPQTVELRRTRATQMLQQMGEAV
ncbi:uncharacterized protein SPSC_02959 [Sporisorium scitamineum]|uniref:WKF domain-containing protein n=1 Tax=Sporisorium scitamineum TaxID=49012 RepID=A0A127Z826_9BASI|nr:uncharacterized protein SPSC_02959 [Sporisorium scitamineum]